MKKLLSAALGLALVLALALVPAFADGGAAVSDMSGLEAAIEAAQPGDVITLAPGTYTPRSEASRFRRSARGTPSFLQAFSTSVTSTMESSPSPIRNASMNR